MRRELKILLAAAAILYGAGVWWGLPLHWGPDELNPDLIFDAIERHFAGGWHDKYPPVAYLLNAIVCLPAHMAAGHGWLSLTSPVTQSTLLILMRLVAVTMSVAAVSAIFLAGRELYGRRGALVAAIVGGFTPVFVFYAKLANVDAPSMCWLAWALYFYVRAVRGGHARDLVGYGLTAVTAIATKDQTGGFFVLPSLHLAWIAARHRAWRPLLVAGGVSLVVLVFEMGVPFNLAGFTAHVAMITGDASQPYRFPGSTLARQTLVAKMTFLQLAWTMTWPGLAAGLAGIALEVRRRRFLWLLWPALSYYVCFLVVAGYVYDRFLIGLGFVLALFAGGLVDVVLGAAAARWRVAAVASFSALVAWWGVSMDMMMILDSRDAATQWVLAHRMHGGIGLVGPSSYLPYIPAAVRLLGGPDGFDADRRPLYIVVNAEWMRRRPLPPLETAWQQFLDSGDSGYVVAARFKTLPPASFLSYSSVFRNGVEDPLTNLDKVGPEIVVYWRPAATR